MINVWVKSSLSPKNREIKHSVSVATNCLQTGEGKEMQSSPQNLPLLFWLFARHQMQFLLPVISQLWSDLLQYNYRDTFEKLEIIWVDGVNDGENEVHFAMVNVVDPLWSLFEVLLHWKKMNFLLVKMAKIRKIQGDLFVCIQAKNECNAWLLPKIEFCI